MNWTQEQPLGGGEVEQLSCFWSAFGERLRPGTSLPIAVAGAVIVASVAVTITGQSSISNGDFRGGLWGPVADCRAANPGVAGHVSGSVLESASAEGLP